MSHPWENVPTLYAAIVAHQAAKEDVDRAWRWGEFAKLLRGHAQKNTRTPLFRSQNPDEYPRLRSYRGTGYKMDLRHFHVYEHNTIIELEIDADWVNASVDPLDESVGCPGADVRTFRHRFQVPAELLQHPTQKAFDQWVKREYERQHSLSKSEAIETICQLQKAFDIDLTVLMEKAG